MTSERRDEIGHFCRDLFRGGNQRVRDIVTDYKHLFVQMNMVQMDFTEETFSETLERICRKVFTCRTPVPTSYVIAILGYALEVNRCLKDNSNNTWYKTDMLINVMVNVLEEVGFDCRQLVPVVSSTNCILL